MVGRLTHGKPASRRRFVPTVLILPLSRFAARLCQESLGPGEAYIANGVSR